MEQHTDHDEEHRKIRRDLWEGDGLRNPSVTTRLAVLEETMDKVTANINKLIWLVVSLVATVIGNMIYHSMVR